MSDAERMKLVSIEQSLAMEPEPRIPSNMAGIENFTLTRKEDRLSPEAAKADAEAFFNIAPGKDDDGDDDNLV
jgi:hypothetical protein